MLIYYILYDKISSNMIQENKNIYICWCQGFKNAPDIIKLCLNRWKVMNPTWNIIELDDTNIHKWVNISEKVPNVDKLSYQAKTDILRIMLIAKYGGVWVDASTYCLKPLDTWLYKVNTSGFFAYRQNVNGRILSNWFLYGNPNNYIIKTCEKEVTNYWHHSEFGKKYFWFHELFNELCQKNRQFKRVWELTPDKQATGPHSYADNNLMTDYDTEMFKLSKKMREDIILSRNTILDLSKIKHKYNRNVGVYKVMDNAYVPHEKFKY